MHTEQLERLATGTGFVAALDQSGGSTPRTLTRYGYDPADWAGDEEMFDLVHAMRQRVMRSPAFTGERILAAILFEQTMDREVDGRPTPEHLWQGRGIVPIVKVDKGLEPEADGVQLMKELTGLDTLLERALARQVFGTKMRSLIRSGHSAGIAACVAQQFYYGRHILDAGLVPILEPEVDIHAPDKADCERLLRLELLEHLNGLDGGRRVLLKLTPPEVDDYYTDLVAHPAVLRVVALSGGWSRAEACARLARNHGLIASFSRALLEGLTKDLTDEEFDETLAAAIDEIYRASAT